MKLLNYLLILAMLVLVGIGIHKLANPTQPTRPKTREEVMGKPRKDSGPTLRNAPSVAAPDTSPAGIERDRERLAILMERGIAKEGETLEEVRLRMLAESGPEETNSVYRWRFLSAIVELWGQEEWVKQWIVSLTGPEEKDPHVRWYAIRTLVQVWGKEEWVKDVLLPLVGPEEKDALMRVKAIEKLVEVRGKEEWVKDLLVPLAYSEEQDVDVRVLSKEYLREHYPELLPPEVPSNSIAHSKRD